VYILYNIDCCHQKRFFDQNFGGQSPPGPTGGAYSAPPDPIASLRVALREGGERSRG